MSLAVIISINVFPTSCQVKGTLDVGFHLIILILWKWNDNLHTLSFTFYHWVCTSVTSRRSKNCRILFYLNYKSILCILCSLKVEYCYKHTIILKNHACLHRIPSWSCRGDKTYHGSHHSRLLIMNYMHAFTKIFKIPKMVHHW